MTKPQDTLTSLVSTTITASTDNPHDQGYHHCFEQKHDAILTFEVNTDPSVDNINFVLWDINDPVNPSIAEPPSDWHVQNGQVKITIGPDPIRSRLPFHLGPGPYCAALAASSSAAASDTSKSAGKIVGNALYYYETWKRNCKYQ
jgi:hypothetical protein